MCGVRNKGVNIVKYVYLSGIYQIWDVAYVFWETIVNSPRILILGNKLEAFYEFYSIWSSGRLAMSW